MDGKQDEILVAEEGVQAAAVEVPPSPTIWPFATCISDAMEQDVGQEDAVGICTMIREDLGHPEDPDSILLPEGLEASALITAAGIQSGIMKPEGATGSGEEAPEQTMRFTGKNRWLRSLSNQLGLNRPKTRTEQELARLSKEIQTMKRTQSAQEALLKNLLGTKSKDELIQLLLQDRDIAYRALGLLPGEGTDAETEAPTPEPEVIEAAVEGEEKAKSTEEGDLWQTDRARLEELEALVGTGSQPEDPTAPEPGTPLVDEDVLQEVAAHPEPYGPTEPKRRRKSKAPTSGPGAKDNGLVVSTVLGGAQIPVSDRRNLDPGW